MLLTIPQTAERLNLSRASIYRLAREGRLEIVRIGAAARIREADLARLIDELPSWTGSAPARGRRRLPSDSQGA